MRISILLAVLLVPLLGGCAVDMGDGRGPIPYFQAVQEGYQRSFSPGGLQRSFAAGVSHGFGTPTYTDRVETPDGKTTVFRTSCGKVNCKTKVEVED